MDRSPQFQDTRERILSVGESLILARGFSAVGLSEILSKAEVPKGSFYHYFRSKEGFGVALLERYFQGYDSRIAGLFGPGKTGGKEAVLAYFRQWREIQNANDLHHSCLVVKLTAEVCDLSEAMREELSAGMKYIVSCLAKALAEAQAAGTLRQEAHAEELAESLYAMWIGASLMARANGSNLPLERAYRQTEYMLEGKTPTPS